MRHSFSAIPRGVRRGLGFSLVRINVVSRPGASANARAATDMIVRTVDSLFYPMPDGSIEFYPLGVRSRGFVIRSASEARVIRTRTILYYRVLLFSFLLIQTVPLMALALLFELAPLAITGRAVNIALTVWLTALAMGVLLLVFWWYRYLRRWRTEFERTAGRLTLAMAADNAAARFSAAQVVVIGGVGIVGILLVSGRLVTAWSAGSILDSVVRYLQLWLFLLGVVWIGYVIVRRRRATANENTGRNG
jgi:hypothetical protein